MQNPLRRLAVPALVAASIGWGAQAPAQYNYPPGYGGYGWHGWGGGSSSAGRTAAGMGVFAAGAGQAAANVGERNVENSQARAVNAQTAMAVNNYMYEAQQQRDHSYYTRLAEQQKQDVGALGQIQDRILNHPNDVDLENGDALNAQFTAITNPQIYGKTLELAQQPLSGRMVRQLPLNYASGGITYSLMELTSRDTVPAVYARPAFAQTRAAIRQTVAELHKQSETPAGVDPQTTAKLRKELDKVKATLEGMDDLDDQEKFEAEKYLKALYGLTRMIDSPSYDVYLAAVAREPSVPLGELLMFMHAFNLRFGPAKDPATREYYAQLYGMLANLRQAVNAPPPPATPPNPGAPGPNGGDRITNFYAGMPYEHLRGPAAPPPPPAGTQ